MTESRPYSVLFLCTGNSARSILAEALLEHHGRGHFKAYSAGSHPTGTVNPMTLRVLEEAGLPTVGLRSKSWDEFTAVGASPIDFVITVCDKAAAEPCPVWPGHPAMAHWGIADPAAVEGDEDMRLHAFREAFHSMGQRIRLFLGLPIERLAQRQLHKALQDIGGAAGE